MNYNVYFSPAGTTKKVVSHIGAQFQRAEDIDLSRMTLPDVVMKADDFCVFGVPSFGGRIPNIASERLESIKGEQTPAFLVVTYGGRAYEDTLKEMQFILKNNGFNCIAAAAMVARHSIVPDIGAGRPSQKDYSELDVFIAKVKTHINAGSPSLRVPGNIPFIAYGVLPMDVEASDACRKCGVCAKNCPAGAIPRDNPQLTNHAQCISCMRCVYVCPFHVRTANQSKVGMIRNKLKAIYNPDKENEFFPAL